MGLIYEATERVLIAKIPNIQNLTTGPLIPQVTPPSGSEPGAFENIYGFSIRGGVAGPEDDMRVQRFHLLEVDFAFGAPGSLVVAMFMSRINPSGIEAGGNPGAYNSVADDADTWGTFGIQTAYSNPFLGTGGNRLRFAVGGARFCKLVSAAGGAAAEARVYGITERRGGLA